MILNREFDDLPEVVEGLFQGHGACEYDPDSYHEREQKSCQYVAYRGYLQIEVRLELLGGQCFRG